jgi:hypothetical protein
MAVKSMNIMTGPTVAEQQTAIKWLEDAVVSASNESEQGIQAKNALGIIKLQAGLIKLKDEIIKVKGKIIELNDGIIKHQNELIKCQDELTIGLDDSITALDAEDVGEGVKDVKWGDSEVAGEIILAGGFIVYPAGEDVIYLYCPLCGSDRDGGYYGNRFGTAACCHTDKGTGLLLERWVAKLLIGLQGVDEVHSRLTAATKSTLDSPSFDRTPPPLRGYVERISALLLDERTAADYRIYLVSK